MATASIASRSLPVSRGSVVDSELSDLIHEYPEQARAYLASQFACHHEHGPSSNLSPNLARAPFNGRTNYQETYFPKTVDKIERPREPKRKYVPPQIPMEITSKQRDDFKMIDSSYFQREIQNQRSNNDTQITHDPSWSAASLAKTSYQDDFPKKELQKLWRDQPHQKSKNRLMLREDSIKMDDTSVTKNDYKSPWIQNEIQAAGGRIRFGELPTFASLIFPVEVKDGPPESTTRRTFKNPHDINHSHTLTEPARPPESNLKLMGEQDFLTTQRESYPRDIFRDWDKIRPPPQKKDKTKFDETYMKREKLHSETQFSSDYKSYGTPKRPQYVRVISSDFNLFDKNNSFGADNENNTYKSVTSASFPGYDVRQYPLPKSFKKESDQYVPPEEKFVSETVTHSSFQPIDLSQIPTGKIVKRERKFQPIGSKQSEFEGKSFTQEVYKDWSKYVRPRIRHGDLLEVCNYMPPSIDKRFMGTSETKEAFIPKLSETPIRASKPTEETTSLWDQNAKGSSFETVYRKSYHANQPKYHLSKAQADELKNELKQLKLRKL